MVLSIHLIERASPDPHKIEVALTVGSSPTKNQVSPALWNNVLNFWVSSRIIPEESDDKPAHKICGGKNSLRAT